MREVTHVAAAPASAAWLRRRLLAKGELRQPQSQTLLADAARSREHERLCEGTGGERGGEPLPERSVAV
jgi:hypothetical protein